MSIELNMVHQHLEAIPRGDGGGGPTWLVVLALVIVGGGFLIRFLFRR